MGDAPSSERGLLSRRHYVLAPNLRLASRCLVLLVGSIIVSAFSPARQPSMGIRKPRLCLRSLLLTQARNNWRAIWSASVVAEREKARGSKERGQAEQDRASLAAAIEQAAEEILITDLDGTN
jgi:hypothetical protein